MSDTTPTWVAVNTAEILSLEWWAGIDREGNDPEPGGMVVRLKNANRKWEPLFGSNTIDTNQRFRLTLDGVQEGVWYTADFALDFPSDGDYSEVTVMCGDGFDVLALNDLPTLDPPEAQTYPDVVNYDEPGWYGRLGDPSGTVAVAQVRKVWRGKGKNRRKVKRRVVTHQIASEASGVAGNSGVYRNATQLILGRPGAVVGDADTAVYFTSSGSTRGHVRVPLSGTELFNDTQAFSLEAWVKEDTVGSVQVIMAGPSTGGNPIWKWTHGTNGNDIELHIHDTGGSYVRYSNNTNPLTSGLWSHVLIVYDNREAHIFVDGEEVAGAWSAVAPTLDAPAADTFLYIGADIDGAQGSTGVDIDEPAVFEHALTGARCHAHYTAGTSRGREQEEASLRIAALASVGPWSVIGVGGIGRDVVPIMHYGQDRLEEIAETVRAEGPRSMLYFNGLGSAKYLGNEWKSTDAVYNTVQATFTDDGTGIPYDDFVPHFDNEVYTTVEANREGGTLVTVTNETEEDARRRRNNTDYTDLILTDDVYVESLAGHVLRLYERPSWRIPSLTVNGAKALTQIKTLDIGHLIRVKKSGVTGAAMDRIAHIIGKRKTLDRDRNLTCTWTLGRDFDANGGVWRAGIVGFSEAGSTTIAA